MTGKVFRNTIWAILLASALFRFGFLIAGDVLPVMWDARRYASAALGLISFVDTSHPPVVGANSEKYDRAHLLEYQDKYIQGDHIDWLSYKPHTLTQAREELFFSGPLYPLCLSIIFFLSPVADFFVAGMFGALMDVLSNFLLILIGVRLVGRKAALIAGVAYALYFPFTLASSMLLLETSTSFYLLFALYLLLRGSERKNNRLLIGAGLLIGLLILNKPTAMLLGFPLVFGWYFYQRKEWSLKLFFNRLMYVAIPAVILFLAWMTVTSIHYGQLALRDPQYAQANLRQSTSIIFEGYDLDHVEKDFWTKSISDELLGDIPGAVGLLVKKFDRLWSRPFNDFKKSFIIPYGVSEYIHLIIVLTGLLGLILLAQIDFGKAGWILAIIGYYTAIHVIFHSISRYNFNAMPMVMLLSGWFIAVSYDLWSKANARIGLLVAIMLLVLAWVFSSSWIGLMSGLSLTLSIVILSLIIKSGCFVTAVRLLVSKVSDQYTQVKPTLTTIVVSCIVILVGTVNTLARDEWAEFSRRLDDPDMKAGVRLYMKSLGRIPHDEILAVVVDLNSGSGRSNTFTLSFGDSYEELVGGKPPLSDLVMIKPTYAYYSEFSHFPMETYRQYAILPIDADSVQSELEQVGYIDLWVAINKRFEEPNNYIDLYGQVLTSSDEQYIPGIRFTSIERFVHEGDPRIRYPVKFLSDSSISYYIGRNELVKTAGEDLSDMPGIQVGRYRLFLIHFRRDGSFLVY